MLVFDGRGAVKVMVLSQNLLGILWSLLLLLFTAVPSYLWVCRHYLYLSLIFLPLSIFTFFHYFPLPLFLPSFLPLSFCHSLLPYLSLQPFLYFRYLRFGSLSYYFRLSSFFHSFSLFYSAYLYLSSSLVSLHPSYLSHHFLFLHFFSQLNLPSLHFT